MRTGFEDKDTLVSAVNKAKNANKDIVLQAFIIMYIQRRAEFRTRNSALLCILSLSTCVWYLSSPIHVIALPDTGNKVTRYR